MNKKEHEVPVSKPASEPFSDDAQAVIESLEHKLKTANLEIEKAKKEIERLKGMLRLNSSNSSKPPSSDGLKKKNVIPGSQRPSSRRRPGGQPGHKGSTLIPVSSPDKTEFYPVNECVCGSDLSLQPALKTEVSQSFDLPPIQILVTEHHREVKICPCCHTKVTASLPPGLSGATTEYGPQLKAYAMYLMNQHLIPVRRVSEILNELLGVEISIGTIMSWSDSVFRGLKSFEEQLKEAIISSPVVNFDETGMRCTGSLHWLHSASTPNLSFFGIHEDRGTEAMKDFGILSRFRGVAVHDHWKSYFKFEDCLHSLCNSHILRELKFLHEVFQECWAGKMIALLLEIKKGVAFAQSVGEVEVSRKLKRQFLLAYKKVLRSGCRYHKKNDPIFKSGARGRTKQTKGKNLLDRLQNFQAEVLRFMNDFTVPFTNNLGEQDIRMNKVKQKISGCFRSFSGAKTFCRIRSYLSTMRKQGHNILDALHAVFLGQPIPIA